MRNRLAIPIGLLICLLTVSVSMAGEMIKPTTPGPSHTPSVTPGKAMAGDLSVSVTEVSGCKCDLSDVDAIYVNNIGVASCLWPDSDSTKYELTVTYFDLLKGQNVVFKKIDTWPAGNRIEFPGCNTSLLLTKPTLIKKSSGIRAEIKSTAPVYFDRNMSNNAMVTNDCGRRLAW
jgi:hypothetical protein